MLKSNAAAAVMPIWRLSRTWSNGSGRANYFSLESLPEGIPVPGQQRSRNPHGRSTFAMIFSQLCRRAREGPGIASAFGTPIHRGCNDSVVADYWRIPSGSPGGERAGARLGARLCPGGRDRGPALAVGAGEGRPAARHARDRKAASRRALADRARWQRGRHLAGAPWRPAVFLVHRDQGAGGGLLACDAHPPAGGSRMRYHARDQGARGQTGRAGLRGGEHLAPCATPGIAQARTCSPPGSRSCSTIRSMRSRRGRRCTRSCATPRAISCSTISASTKTLKSIFVPTAPIFPTLYVVRAFRTVGLAI